MDTTNFAFLKSGHDLLEKKDETLENVGSIAMVFMENAIRNAEIYIKHGNRTSVTTEDIKRGFMLEVFFMKSRPNMKEQCIEMKKKILEIIKKRCWSKKFQFEWLQNEEVSNKEIINPVDCSASSRRKPG